MPETLEQERAFILPLAEAIDYAPNEERHPCRLLYGKPWKARVVRMMPIMCDVTKRQIEHYVRRTAGGTPFSAQPQAIRDTHAGYLAVELETPEGLTWTVRDLAQFERIESNPSARIPRYVSRSIGHLLGRGRGNQLARLADFWGVV